MRSVKVNHQEVKSLKVDTLNATMIGSLRIAWEKSTQNRLTRSCDSLIESNQNSPVAKISRMREDEARFWICGPNVGFQIIKIVEVNFLQAEEIVL